MRITPFNLSKRSVPMSYKASDPLNPSSPWQTPCVQTLHCQKLSSKELHWQELDSTDSMADSLASSSAHSPPLLLLHGWGRDLSQLRPLAELLTQNRDVWLIDLPGFGQSLPPETVWNSFDYARRLIQFLDEEQIKQVDLLGHSFGGKVALSLALGFSERVRKLILIAPSGLKRHRSSVSALKMIALRYASKTIKSIDRLFSTRLFESLFAKRFGSIDYQRAKGVMRSILVRSIHEDLSDQVAAIKQPTLLLWGEQDQETPTELAYRLHRALVHSKLHLLPHKGHEPFQEVGAHLCAHHILGFLSDKNPILEPR